MKRIALTGGIACGKSLVATYLNEFGIETIDADEVKASKTSALAEHTKELLLEYLGH